MQKFEELFEIFVAPELFLRSVTQTQQSFHQS